MVDKKPEPAKTSPSIIGVIPRHTHRHLIGLAILALVIIISLIWVELRGNSTTTPNPTGHFLYTDSTNNTASITDSANKVITKTTYPVGNYVNFEGASSDGSELLVSQGGTPQDQTYTLIKDGKAQSLSDAATSVLRSSPIIDSRHQLFFSDNNTVEAVVCGSNASCKLESLDITTGKTDVVADTGIKNDGGLTPAYLLGLSSDNKVAYLRTIGKGSLSKSPGALYQIDIKSHKVLKEIDLSQDIGYSVSLSPDKQKLIYKTGGYTTATTMHVLDLKTFKDSTAKWSGFGQLSDVPSTFSWSPDSSKVVMHTVNIIVQAGTDPVTNKLTSAYLDVSKMSVTSLQTINDPTHSTITSEGWADDNNVIYQLSTSNNRYDFDNGTLSTFKQNLTTKQSTKLQSYGHLNYVIYW